MKHHSGLAKTVFTPVTIIIVIALGLTLNSCKHSEVKRKSIPACPDLSQGETPEDCPWAGIARSTSFDLAEMAPELWTHIQQDAGHHNFLSLWGESINFDENVKATIVDPAILDTLLTTMKAPPRKDRIVHAGIEHTYGYLFSVLKTPYGFKRARWVRDDIQTGLGLPPKTLSPLPSEGTLFQNVTYLLSRIALTDDLQAIAQLKLDSAGVSPALKQLDYTQLNVQRIEETVVFKNKKERNRSVVLRTDVVTFPQVPPTQKNTHLLIYSIQDNGGESTQNRTRLISAFPIEATFAEKLLDPKTQGKNLPIVTRYNAYVKGLTDQTPPLKGTRKLWPKFKIR